MYRKDRKRLKKARTKPNGSGGARHDIDASLGRITALLQSSQAGEARGLCQSLLETHPEDARVLNLGAIACFQTGDSETARALLEAATRHQPDFVDAYNNLGNVLKAEGDLSRAESAYRKAIDLAPGYSDAHFNLGIVLEAMGRPAQARDAYKAALDIQPDFLPAYFNTGNSLKALGKFDEALDYYRFVLQVEPRNVDALTNVGAVYYELTRFDEAETTYREALAIDSKHADAHYNLGVVLHELERYDEAVDSYRDAIAARPHYAECHVNLGYTLHTLGRLDEAEDAYKRAIELDPDNAQAHANLGDVSLDRGDPRTALALCNRFLETHPGNTAMLAFKTFALREAGELDAGRALTRYDTLLEIRELPGAGGYPDRKSLNAALAAHIEAHPSLVDAPASHATRAGKHSGELLGESEGPVAAWEAALREAIEAYRTRLAGAGPHPFVDSMPSHYRLTAWSVVMPSGGHQIAHIHPSAWMSGVYYVEVPEAVSESTEDTAGWIEFGEPPEHFHTSSDPERLLERPRAGLLVLFPSYYYHRTIPFESAGRRISIAFDVMPWRGPEGVAI